MKKSFKTSQKTYLIIIASLLISTLLFFSLFIIFSSKYYQKSIPENSTTVSNDTKSTDSIDSIISTEVASAQTQLLNGIKQDLSDGTSVITLLRKLYPNNIIYYDKSGYVFKNKNYSLKQSNFVMSNFIKNENNEISYIKDSKVISHKGIDVSRFQGKIEWNKVKASGVEYAMIRTGYRAYGTGIITPDTSFKENIEGAIANNISVGVYFFTQAVNNEEAIEEANYVLDSIKGYNVTYPIVIDVEEILNDTYRQQSLSQKELTDIVITFCNTISQSGYTPMIYYNLKGMCKYLDFTQLESYEKWFAFYDDNPYIPYDISMWQYTDSGTVDGITGKVDLNISFKTWK